MRTLSQMWVCGYSKGGSKVIDQTRGMGRLARPYVRVPPAMGKREGGRRDGGALRNVRQRRAGDVGRKRGGARSPLARG